MEYAICVSEVYLNELRVSAVFNPIFFISEDLIYDITFGRKFERKLESLNYMKSLGVLISSEEVNYNWDHFLFYYFMNIFL